MVSNEMKLTILGSLSLLFHGLVGFTLGNVFVINRNTLDTFTIPSSICDQAAASECEPFQANRQQSCSCECPGENATFVFDDYKWTCLANGRIRKFQETPGCRGTTFFKYVEKTRPAGQLLALNTQEAQTTKIDIPFDDTTGWKRCGLNLNNSWFLGCNGSWLQSNLYLSKMKDLFSFPPSSTDSYFTLKVHNDVPDTQMLQGRIVNLGIWCTNSSQHQYHGCLMFKLTGQQQCPVTMPKPQTSSAPKKALLATPTPTAAIGTRSRTFAAQPNTLAESIVTLSTPTPSPPNVLSHPSLGREQSTSRGSLGLIAGITVSAVLLVSVNIVCFLFYRRRYRSNEPSVKSESIQRKNAQDTMMMYTQTNSAFQCGDGENFYRTLSIKATERQIYASMYNVPQRPATKQDDPNSDHVYAPVNIQVEHNICGPGNTQEPFYNVLEQSTTDSENQLQNDGSSCSEQPVYNFLEEQSTPEGPKRPISHGAEPVYNVLEDTNVEDAEGTDRYGSIFSVGLDDSESTNEPVSNVLEEDTHGSISAVGKCATEERQKPVYYVLEGP